MKKVFGKEHVGMTVYDFEYGEGKITQVYSHTIYAVCVKGLSGYNRSYTTGGMYTVDDSRPTLSFRPWKMPVDCDKPPVPIFKVDTKLLVSQGGKNERKRYFSHFDATKHGVCCFRVGGTSWSSPGVTEWWSQWRLAD